MISQPQDHTQTTAITLTQLAALVGRDPSWVSLHKDELPNPVPIHDGSNGRPQICFPLDAISALVIERTGHLSEAECRLRLAVSGHRPPVEKDRARMQSLKNLPPLRIVTNSSGEHIVVFDDPRLHTETDRAEAEAALAFERTRSQPRQEPHP